jgi:hypothetical protein
MSPQMLTDHLEDRARVGRGRELQFFATDSEVRGRLLSALPPEYGSYTLVGFDSVKEGSRPLTSPSSARCRQGRSYPA